MGPNVALTLLDFGARSAKVEQARGVYDENVATYRQTVLTALQDVETQLAALRVLEQEASVQDEASDLAEKGVMIALNRYKAGIAGYTDVVVAVNQALANQQRSIQIAQQRLNASVLLIKALGGSWDKQLPKASTISERETNQPSANKQAKQGPGGEG